ncbi:TIGR01212 family radical SAM protein [Laribacter hongkongensis]|uniref:YhcC n=1 Tax=Laribacter hongkongensis TaxID=168471 RepID=A0A248LNE8_9NEIS|nr:TIGR01212 family radical SAM protein [Laribacter hongkongensis]MBP6802141.1 TIGR01212 family radical SAM protein [Zoogloea sp.]ASJ25974.1 YhcC [Laribacter hongkongensis]MCG9040032.1 TIGR01212 family radical SAM protein [Laribacter hongkongensis]MCG9068293.1 TIGR01212 family radical SAM protein [Laribacter hongkongensis]MCG9109657.1 TIGR01212 family radical SAM protein [Laribacter hongkongensis]
MQLDHYVHTLGRHLKARFGERVHKLALNAAFTCPNRDGTLGRGGCTFCNVRAFSRTADIPLAEQLQQAKTGADRARKYLAYFQAYTNTYAEVATLRGLYEAALTSADVVGLCVGTRPDCVPDAVLDLLAGYRDQGYEVWLELGLQSACDETLARINRGHGWAAYADAVRRARLRGLAVCTHLIVGLPGESPAQPLETLARVVDAGVEGLKLHPLHIVRGSRMAAQFRRGELAPVGLEEYAGIACELIRHTPPAVVFHRVSATAKRDVLLAPDWCADRWPSIQAITGQLACSGPQGSALGQPWQPPQAGDTAARMPSGTGTVVPLA